MTILVVSDLAAIGVVQDADPTLLPPNAWTRVKNIRFADGSVQKFPGHSSIATPTVSPYYLLPVTKAADAYWVYCGLDKVYSYDGTTHANITRQTTGADVDYTGTAANLWTGGVLNGVLVLSNGVDDPQMWVSAKLASLQWDSGNTWAAKGYTAFTLRPYRNFLVALGWSDGSNDYPQTVYWSNQADPLTVPSDWDYADPANDAGISELAATNGYLLDAEPLRDSLMIYKEDAIHRMTYAGGAFVMNFADVSRTTGALGKRCAKEFFGKHFVLGNDDLIVHDGQSIESVALKKVRRAVFSSIDQTNYGKAYVVRNLGRSEMWVCYPETGATDCNIAAVWNWRDGTWSWREIPAARHIGYGIAFESSDASTWNADAESWDSDTTTWASRAFNPSAQMLLAANDADIHLLDFTTQFDGADIDSYCERDGIVLDNIETVKMVRRIYPRATGGPMRVSIGSRAAPNAGVQWEGPYTFTPGTDHKIEVRSTGRLHAIKFQFDGDTACTLEGYDLEYVQVGER